MDNIKIFNKGLNSDISPVFQQDDTYVDALNIELINDELQGSVAISNSRGNKFQVAIPNLTNIAKITFTAPGFANINIDGQIGPGIVINSIKDLYDYINTDPAYTFLGTRYTIYYSGLYMIIYPIGSFAIAPLIVTGGLSLNTSYIPSQSNQQVIGYGLIRDDIYIFSTSNKTIDPKITGNGYGFIWRIRYNNLTYSALDATIDLIYAADLAFSTYWNIPQTGVVGRYENSSIQRLYWTDNYNKLRSINVADPQVGAIDPSLIDVAPSVDLDIPILTNIMSAAGTTPIDIGCYQLAYKLSNVSGASTVFSVPSNPVFVVNAAEELQNTTTTWKDYHGDIVGTKTTKRITWKINNLDRDFTRIEAIILFRDSKNNIPSITSFYEGPITSDSIEIIFDGDILNSSNAFTVTIDEFNTTSSVFTHTKTIGSKDNRLIAGNVRNELTDIDYDSRVYRFSAPNAFKLINIKGQVATNYTSADYGNIPLTSDAINPFNLLTTDVNYDANSKYRANGTTIGGEGPNISYEFVSMFLKCDDNRELSDPQPLPLFSTSPSLLTDRLRLNVFSRNKNNIDILQEYTNNFPSKINDGMKYPQFNSVLWGYQHNEIYRFGIQFFDKQKNPYFVKWIGDIKFPDYFDVCPAANNIRTNLSQTGLTDYRIGFDFVTGPEDSQLGIKFNINIPANLTSKISGYSIVRVKREEVDKTVVAEGIISNKMLEVAPFSYELPATDMNYNGAGLNANKIQFITPNILDASLAQPAAGMKVRVSSYLDSVNSLQNVNIVGGITSIHKNYIYKLYDHQARPSFFEANIDYATLMGLNSYTAYLTDNFNNYSSSGVYRNNGNPAYLFVIDGPGLNSAGVIGDQKLLAYIYNPIVNQYGGNTYTDRGNNEYILCSHFRGIKTSLTDYNDSSLIYGGDVTNGIMDEERVSKQFINPDNDLFSTTFLYLSKSPVNRELRHGSHPNISLFDVINNNNDRTDYFYNTVYSSQNEVVKFYPRPAIFEDNTVFDNRFYISEIKINGELTDSWSVFKPNNYWDVEGIYGPINSMLILSEKMYFWQDRAFGIIQVNPRTVFADVNSSTNSQVNVGTGLPLQRHDYISTTIGSKHQGSTISSSTKLFWFDVNTKKIYSYDGSVKPFSDIEGLYSYLSKNIDGNIQNIDKPTYNSIGNDTIGINGISATYDHKRHKAIYTFHSGINTGIGTVNQTSFTVVINELLNCFTTFHSFTPRIYINDYKNILSTDNTDITEIGLRNLYIHDLGNYGEYYDTIYPTYIKYIVNENPKVKKVFDNISYDSQARVYDPITKQYINFNDTTWSSIRITNDYQNTDTQALVLNSNIKREERTWHLAIPRNRVLYTLTNSPNIYTDLSVGNKSFGERIRDKYIQVELTYNNSSNRELITNNIITTYRESI